MTAQATHQPVILITGGTGFAGRHLTKLLTDAGENHIHVTHAGSRPVPESCLHPNVHRHAIDLTDAKATTRLIQEILPTHIYHLASFAAVGKSFERAAAILQNNIQLQANILESVRNHAPSARVLVIGSAEEYGRLPDDFQGKISESVELRPVNPYAVTKVAQDLLGLAYFLSYDLDIVRVRPFNHIGPGQTADFVVPAFASQIVEVERGTMDRIRVGNLSPVRDFTDVHDMVRAYRIVMEKGEKGQVYNIGSGRGWSVQEILDMLIAESETTIRVEIDQQRFRPSDIPYFVADNTRVTQLGWSPLVPIQETLQSILKEWRENV